MTGSSNITREPVVECEDPRTRRCYRFSTLESHQPFPEHQQVRLRLFSIPSQMASEDQWRAIV
jgi:hypothetical protein